MDCAAVAQHGILNYGEPKSGTALTARASGVHPVEPLEEVWQMGGRNTYSIVRKAEGVMVLAVLLHAPALDAEACGSGGIVDSIVHQIAHNAINELRRAGNDNILWDVHHGRDVPRMEGESCILQCSVDNVGYVYLTHLSFICRGAGKCCVQFGQGVHVLQQAAHALALGIAPLQKVLTLLGRNAGILQYSLQETVYAGSRGLELVCHVLCELPFDARLLGTGMMQVPVELNNGVGDIAQVIIRKAALQTEVYLPALLCLTGKAPQMPYVATDARCCMVEEDKEEECQQQGSM